MSNAACKLLLCGSDNAAASPVLMGLAQAVVDGVIKSNEKLDAIFLKAAEVLDAAAKDAAEHARQSDVFASQAMAVAFP